MTSSPDSGTVRRVEDPDLSQSPAPSGEEVPHRHPFRRERAPFSVVTDFAASVDQRRAVDEIAAAVESGDTPATLLGITGSGKSAVMAWTVERLQRPALVLAPNKALAAQLAAELRAMLPQNTVTFFVSYYDYYQPEAYVAASDTYIAKEAQINDEIDRLRHEATTSLLLRRDSIVVASVSAVYGLGSPQTYLDAMRPVRVGEVVEPLMLAKNLVAIGYDRNDVAPSRGQFRLRGDTMEVYPPDRDTGWRIAFFGDEVEAIGMVDPLAGPVAGSTVEQVVLYPTSHWAYAADRLPAAIAAIEAELTERLEVLRGADRLVEAQRLEQRTRHDVEILALTGTCPGVENYSRHLDGRAAGEPPATLLDYLDDDAVVFIDESHVTLGQLMAASAGDRARKESLVEHGFRLPSALDNRPLTFAEFRARATSCVFVSATPGRFEGEVSTRVVELVTRPTGLLDPVVEVHPRAGQLDHLLSQLNATTAHGHRSLVTATTKRAAEDLVEWLSAQGVRARWMHSDVDTVERQQLLRDLRLGTYDTLVGVNLLREGLDLPEVAFVAVLDADVEGFLRSSSALLQTIGRAARNADGRVVLYADTTSAAMATAMAETARRRAIQQARNTVDGVTPTTVSTPVRDVLLVQDAARPATRRSRATTGRSRQEGPGAPAETPSDAPVAVYELTDEDLARAVAAHSEAMHAAAATLDFESAARWRDALAPLEAEQARRGTPSADTPPAQG